MMCLSCITATIIMAYIKIVLAFLKPLLNRPAQVLLQGSSPCDTQRHICWTSVPGWSCWHLLAVSPIPWNFLRMGRGRSKTDIAGGRRRIPEAAIRWRIRFRAAGRGKYRNGWIQRNWCLSRRWYRTVLRRRKSMVWLKRSGWGRKNITIADGDYYTRIYELSDCYEK